MDIHLLTNCYAINNINHIFPATDLGYLLHKHPGRMQSFALTFGQAHVFYPEAYAEKCTAALLLDVDSVGLVRRPHRQFADNFALAQYVSDRPYVASSFLSVAIARVFSSALSGKCKDRPQLVETAIPLSARLSILPCRGGEKLLRRLFEPLGYTITAERHTLDAQFPDWGESRYFTVTLENTCRLSELLTHLYILMPVLDDESTTGSARQRSKSYLKHGKEWLTAHPEQESIGTSLLETSTSAYPVRHLPNYAKKIFKKLLTQCKHKKRSSLKDGSVSTTSVWLRSLKSSSNPARGAVLDLGCGEGNCSVNCWLKSSLRKSSGWTFRIAC